MLDGAITIRAVPVGGTGKNSPLNTPASWPAAPMGYVHDQRGDMKKAPSTILATAGLTVGMLGFALPASAATSVTPIAPPRPPWCRSARIRRRPARARRRRVSTSRRTGTPTPPTGTHTPPGRVSTSAADAVPRCPPAGTHTPPTGTYTPPTGGRPDPAKRRKGLARADAAPPQAGVPSEADAHLPPAAEAEVPVKPIGYNKGSNKYKGYTTALYSWEHPKWGHIVKCDPKPVKHPVKHPAPPKHHHHAPKKHWWQGWFN